MPHQPIKKALRPALLNRTVPVEEIAKFKKNLKFLYEHLQNKRIEENEKGYINDFLKNSYYAGKHAVNPIERIDTAIHATVDDSSPIRVIIEYKRSHATDMPKLDKLDSKAMQETVWYYLKERIKGNNYLNHIIISDGLDWYIFDAHEYNVFYKDRSLVNDSKKFMEGALAFSRTEDFYKEILSPAIKKYEDKINFTHFNLNDYYGKIIHDGKEKPTLELYNIFSDIHLLKKPFANDSNTLNKQFYEELLHIIGLEEVKSGGKKIITRVKEGERNRGSLIENTLEFLESTDYLRLVEEKERYGESKEEQYFGVALELAITWVNRLLFLKLLEGQLLNYNDKDPEYKLMTKQRLRDYGEVRELFFLVLAKQHDERIAAIREKYELVPYLNSSLFEPTKLEEICEINNLQTRHELPLFSQTVLKENGKRKSGNMQGLEYLLEFLNSYDFTRDGKGKIVENTNQVINASVLGLIFEKINGYKDGSFYTPGYITMYMCREAIRAAVIDKFNKELSFGVDKFDHLIEDLKRWVREGNREERRKRANEIVNSLRICDPSVGSGHFLVSALNEIILIKYELGILCDKEYKPLDIEVDVADDELVITDAIGEAFQYRAGNSKSQKIQKNLFREKETIIENCLFGVDINPNSVNICRLRLWIELLKNAYYLESENGERKLQTLPNIDINIKPGNSLLNKIQLNGQDSQSNLAQIDEYKKEVRKYKLRPTASEKENIRKNIEEIKSLIKSIYDKTTKKEKRLKELKDKYKKLINQDSFSNPKKEQIEQHKRLIEKAQLDVMEEQELMRKERYMEWRIEFPEVLDSNGQYMGFDVVIGNPPYIQMQHDGGRLGELLKDKKFETYERTGDIYTLFIERGVEILRHGGILSYITSNKWMRAGYGKSLRRFLATKTNPEMLIDFAGVQVFGEATVDTNILQLRKEDNRGATRAMSLTADFKDAPTFGGYIQNNLYPGQRYDTDEAWTILSPIEKSIKEKIEKAGTPLKDWDVEINYGIKTGYNEAFIVDGATKDRLISEDPKSAELLKPILRGRDIKRYRAEFADLWLIATFPSLNIDIEEYPAVKRYLEGFGRKLYQTGETIINDGEKYKSRKKTSNKWFETQDQIGYWKEFEKEKIVWGNLQIIGGFSFASEGTYINAPSAFITSSDRYLLAVLNSRAVWYQLTLSSVARSGGYREVKPMFVENLHIPVADKSTIDKCTELVNKIIDLKADQTDTSNLESEIDGIVYEMYGLTDEEIAVVEGAV